MTEHTADGSLTDTIRDFVEDGWRLTFRDRNVAQLVRPKRVGVGLMLFPLVYVLVWLATNEGHAYLEEKGATTECVVNHGRLPSYVMIIAGILALAQIILLLNLVA